MAMSLIICWATKDGSTFVVFITIVIIKVISIIIIIITKDGSIYVAFVTISLLLK